MATGAQLTVTDTLQLLVDQAQCVGQSPCRLGDFTVLQAVVKMQSKIDWVQRH